MVTAVGELVTPTGRLVLPADAPHDTWLETRRRRDGVPGGYCIGSSDVPSILDLPGVDTPGHVFHDKVNAIGKDEADAMRYGHLFEPVIAQDWCARNKAVIEDIGIVGHTDEPWHQTSLDRRVVECPLRIDGGCGLEIKNVGARVFNTRWRDDMPDYILAQMVHQLFVTGFHHMHFAVCVGGNEPHQGVVYAEREADLMTYIRREVNAFRERYLLTGTPPPWTAEDKPGRYIELDKRLHPERIGEVGVQDIGDLMEYAEAAAAEGAARKRKEKAKAKLAGHAGGAELVTFADEEAWSYRRDPYVWVDLERLAEKHPEVYADPEVVHHKSKTVLVVAKAYRQRAKEATA